MAATGSNQPKGSPKGSKDSIVFQAITAILCFLGTLILFFAQYQHQQEVASAPSLVAAATIEAPLLPTAPVADDAVATTPPPAPVQAVRIAPVAPTPAPVVRETIAEVVVPKVKKAAKKVAAAPAPKVESVESSDVVGAETPDTDSEENDDEEEDVVVASATTESAENVAAVIVPVEPKPELPVMVDESAKEWIEQALVSDADLVEPSESLNVEDAQDLLVATALDTAPEETTILEEDRTRSWQFDAQKAFDREYPVETSFLETVGIYQRNDYSNFRESLAKLNELGQSIEASDQASTKNVAVVDDGPKNQLVRRPTETTGFAVRAKAVGYTPSVVPAAALVAASVNAVTLPTVVQATVDQAKVASALPAKTNEIVRESARDEKSAPETTASNELVAPPAAVAPTIVAAKAPIKEPALPMALVHSGADVEADDAETEAEPEAPKKVSRAERNQPVSGPANVLVVPPPSPMPAAAVAVAPAVAAIVGAPAAPVASTARSAASLVAPAMASVATVPAAVSSLFSSLPKPRNASSAAPAGPVAESLGMGTAMSTVSPRSMDLATPAVKPTPAAVTTRSDAFDDRKWEERIFGTLTVDPALRQYLKATGGHIQLYVHPERSRDPKDTVFLDVKYPIFDDEGVAQYPDKVQFTVESKEFRGRKQLVAAVFQPKSVGFVSQVVYSETRPGAKAPQVLSADTVKEHVRFALTYADVYAGYRQNRKTGKNVSVWITLYDANSPKYLEPRPIPFGQVRVLNMPERGTLTANKDGNVLLADIPEGFEMVIEASADQYMRTFQTIVTGTGDLEFPVRLLSRTKVDSITRYFAKSPQRQTRCAVMGRTFDRKTRTPEAGDRISMSDRKKKPLYFGLLPDPEREETSENGEWLIHNVIPSLRFVDHEDESPDTTDAAALVHCRADAGQFLEFGRAGEAPLTIKLRDEHGPIAGATVSLIGDESISGETNEQGIVYFGKLDLPADVLTFQVRAKGYPLAWHSVPWNPRERNPRRLLFQVDQRRVDAARWDKVSPTTGRIFGRTRRQLLQQHPGCVSIGITDLDEKPVLAANGPFSAGKGKLGTEAGTKLCLSPQSPEFTFENLHPGEYDVTWYDAAHTPIASRIVRVGPESVAFVLR